MNNLIQKSIIILLLVTAIPLSGCGGPTAIISFQGDIKQSNGLFIMNGTVVDETYSDEHYNNVSIYFYNEDEKLINKTWVGDTRSGKNVNVTLDSIPKYVIIYSPGFWDDSTMTVDYWVLEDGQYMVETAEEQSDLPVVPDN